MTVSVTKPKFEWRRNPVAAGVATAVAHMDQQVQRARIAAGTWSMPTPLMPPVLARRHLQGLSPPRGET